MKSLNTATPDLRKSRNRALSGISGLVLMLWRGREGGRGGRGREGGREGGRGGRRRGKEREGGREGGEEEKRRESKGRGRGRRAGRGREGGREDLTKALILRIVCPPNLDIFL